MGQRTCYDGIDAVIKDAPDLFSRLLDSFVSLRPHERSLAYNRDVLPRFYGLLRAAIDFDEIELAPRRGPDPEDMKDMLPALLQLRRVATKQKLDLTDAFEEAAGKGRDAQLGLMAKNRRGRPPHARAHAPAVRCGAHLWQLSSRPRLRSPRAGLRRRWA